MERQEQQTKGQTQSAQASLGQVAKDMASIFWRSCMYWRLGNLRAAVNLKYPGAKVQEPNFSGEYSVTLSQNGKPITVQVGEQALSIYEGAKPQPSLVMKLSDFEAMRNKPAPASKQQFMLTEGEISQRISGEAKKQELSLPPELASALAHELFKSCSGKEFDMDAKAALLVSSLMRIARSDEGTKKAVPRRSYREPLSEILAQPLVADFVKDPSVFVDLANTPVLFENDVRWNPMGVGGIFADIGSEEMLAIFRAGPPLFEVMVRSTSLPSYQAMKGMLCVQEIAQMNPKTLLMAIWKIVSKGSDITKPEFEVLANPDFAKKFAEDPAGMLKTFSDVASSVKLHRGADSSTIIALANTHLAKLFLFDTDAAILLLSGVADAAGDHAWAALAALAKDEVGKMLVDNPKDFIKLVGQIANMAGDASPQVYAAIGDSRLGAGKFSNDPEGVSAQLVKMAVQGHRSLPGAFLNSTPKQQESMLSDPGRLIGMGKSLSGQFDIENFQRFNYDIIENAYLAATDAEFSIGKKTAIIILNKNDWNKAFEDDTGIYKQLMEQGYCLVLCEANDEEGVATRFFNRGKEDGAPSALGERAYDLVILGGHGTPTSINFGKAVGEKSKFDLGDFKQGGRFLPGSWDSMLNEQSVIILSSCSTGGDIAQFASQDDKSPSSNPGNFQNIMDMISLLATTAMVFAPNLPCGISVLEFDGEGRVSRTIFSSNYDDVQMMSATRRGKKGGAGK